MDEYDGITVEKKRVNGFETVVVDVLTEERAVKLGKGTGKYITITADVPLYELEEIYPIGECLTRFLRDVLQPHFGGKLCICGIGNPEIPADALGPKVTRKLPLKFFCDLPKSTGVFSEVCSIAVGTPFTNNAASGAIIAGVARKTKATCVLLVDSTITDDYNRLSRTIQISNSGGVTPYLSDGKADWSCVEVPIISLGVPTLIPVNRLLANVGRDKDLLASNRVTNLVDSASSIIAYALLRVCFPRASEYECYIFAHGIMPFRVREVEGSEIEAKDTSSYNVSDVQES